VGGAAALVALVALAVLAAACGAGDAPAARGTQTAPGGGALPQGAEPVRLDPRNFTTRIDNPWLPMAAGSRWVYRELEGTERGSVRITVTNRTKVIAGIRARVVHDVARRSGRVIEDTIDWFAQDRAGNVWYLGEATRSYRNGRLVSRGGSWQAGVAGAQAGIAMPADPKPALTYRQEYRKGVAEDAATVLSLDEQVQAPHGHFKPALLTKEFTPVEPDSLEYKLYAKGVGLVLAVDVSGGAAREELVSYRKGKGSG
jgi:hypothetical protein